MLVERDELLREVRADTEDFRASRVRVGDLEAQVAELAATNRQWEDWSNSIAEQMPEHYDGDEAQEAIIDRWIGDLRAQVETAERQRDEARKALRHLYERAQVQIALPDRQTYEALVNARAALDTPPAKEATA